MKYLMIFILLVIGISLFFLKFNKPEKVRVEIEDNPAAADTSAAIIPIPKDSLPDTSTHGVKKKVMKADQTDRTLKRFEFHKYDHIANAQAFVSFLKEKGLSFPAELEKRGSIVYISFEFIDIQDKKDKLKELEKLTGLKFHERS